MSRSILDLGRHSAWAMAEYADRSLHFRSEPLIVFAHIEGAGAIHIDATSGVR